MKTRTGTRARRTQAFVGSSCLGQTLMQPPARAWECPRGCTSIARILRRPLSRGGSREVWFVVPPSGAFPERVPGNGEKKARWTEGNFQARMLMKQVRAEASLL